MANTIAQAVSRHDDEDVESATISAIYWAEAHQKARP